MTDKEILEGIRKYFKITELVGELAFSVYGDTAWQFLDMRLLHALLLVRKGLDRPITVNTWYDGGDLSQRGLRTNVQPIFAKYFKEEKLYLSAHVLGKGVDFDVRGMSANKVREWIKANKELFPFKIRLERNKKGKPISWVHMDVIQTEGRPKIYEFDV